MKALFLTAAVVTLAVSLVGTHVLSKRAGRKESVKILREGQLEQAREELDIRIERKECPAYAQEVYELECATINEMYEDILNNHC